MLQRLSKAAVAAAIAGSLTMGPMLARPAAASTGSTYTLIETGLALIGGIILYNNYQHKRQAATRVVGYTRNGGTVYGDGRIVMPDGTTIYPGRNGRYSWGQYAYYAPQASGYTYDYSRTGQYDRTHRHGYDRDDYQREVRARGWHEHGHRGHGHGHGHGHDHDGDGGGD